VFGGIKCSAQRIPLVHHQTLNTLYTMETLFKQEADITNQWLLYLEEEALALSKSGSDFTIDNYADMEVLNPQMQAYLMSDNAALLDAEADPVAEPMILSAAGMSNAVATPQWGRFRRLKAKIRRIFCGMVDAIRDLSWKEIIKKLLLALIPAFAGGVPAIALPIVVALVAAAMKRGFNAVCPA